MTVYIQDSDPPVIKYCKALKSLTAICKPCLKRSSHMHSNAAMNQVYAKQDNITTIPET